MELLKSKRKKHIKLSDEALYQLVSVDKRNAENEFSRSHESSIVMRYDLMHSSSRYYNQKFKKLSRASKFSATDIKDTIEWIMPSLAEVYFGSDNIVGIFGRSPRDNPQILEHVIEYQLKSQNNMYQVFGQWIRDSLETGLGVVRVTWEREEKKERNWYRLSEEEFLEFPEEAMGLILKTEQNEPGFYDIYIEEEVVKRNQPLIENVKPGEYIWLDNKSYKNEPIYSAYRRYVPLDFIMRKSKEGVYRNVDKDFPLYDVALGSNASALSTIEEARSNYSKSYKRGGIFDFLSSGSKQESRKEVLLYDHYGYYDVDNDGILELIHVTTCNGRVLFSEIMEDETIPFFKIHFFSNSYQEWKEGVADILQDIQDLRTALIRQIIFNANLNNNRMFLVNERCENALEDLREGRTTIRVKAEDGSINDFIKPMPKYEIDGSTFNLLEFSSVLSEQKTGVTRYNQGLDADSLNKTATGISKIMAASQQRLRKMARDGAESGIVPLYKYLVLLDKNFLDEEFIFRISEDYYEFAPDDVKGDYDVQIVSNIGLQDKQLTIQNLIFLYQQLIPALVNSGQASPEGLTATLKQIIRSMGFSNPETFLYGDGSRDKNPLMPLMPAEQVDENLLEQHKAEESAMSLDAQQAAMGAQQPLPGQGLPPEEMPMQMSAQMPV